VLDAIAAAVATDGDAYGDGILIQGDDGTNRRAVLVGEDGHVQVDVLAAPAVRALTNADVVTAELSATDNAVLDAIDTAIDAINAKLVTGTVIGDVNLGATDNAVLDAIAASLAIVDDWDSPADHCNIRHLNATDDIVQLGTSAAAIGKLAANTGVDIGDVDVLSVIPGVGATNLGKAEDAGHSSGDVGVMALAVRTDVPASLASATAEYIPFITNKLGCLWTSPQPTVPHKNIDVDETEDAVSAAPCVLSGFYAFNNAAAGTKRFLKLYNATVATVVVGTTVPDMTFELDGGQGLVWNTPLLFTTALTIAATGLVADNDATAPAANDVVFNCGYIVI